MPSDGCRSCKEYINIEINNKPIFFPDISAVEETLENLFLSSYFKFIYESANFKIDMLNDKFIIDILDNESLILKDENELYNLETKLCDLLKSDE